MATPGQARPPGVAHALILEEPSGYGGCPRINSKVSRAWYFPADRLLILPPLAASAACDFCEHEVAKECELTPAMVFVLRFYTTWGFVNINSLLRDPDLMDRKTSHKLGATVYQLSEAIKLSRQVAAVSAEANEPLSLFRGIGKREMDANFKKEGGKELAPMSAVRKFLKILLRT